MQRDLLLLYKEKQEDSLFLELKKEYGGLIIYYANIMYRRTKLYGEELEDCIQLCWICFLKAVENYDTSSETNFTAFLVSCLTHYMINYVRDYFRRKNSMPTISYNNYADEEERITYLDMFESDVPSPAKTYELNESMTNFLSISKISETEKRIFLDYLRGYTYLELAKAYNVSKKRVDNIIRKVKGIISIKNKSE